MWEGKPALPQGGNKMAKKVIALVKLQIPAGKATPAPPVGTARTSWCKHHAVHKGI